jgi:hypothetical protein
MTKKGMVTDRGSGADTPVGPSFEPVGAAHTSPEFDWMRPRLAGVSVLPPWTLRAQGSLQNTGPRERSCDHRPTEVPEFRWLRVTFWRVVREAGCE